MSNSRIDGSPIDDQEWLKAAMSSPAVSFLKEPQEDIYTLADGRPFAWDSNSPGC